MREIFNLTNKNIGKYYSVSFKNIKMYKPVLKLLNLFNCKFEQIQY